MSDADQLKWDARYRAGSYSERRHPTALLARFLDRLPKGAALDIGCGAGRNSLALAESGYTVDAVDISAAGLERLRTDAKARKLTVNTLEADLEHGFPDSLALKDCYDLIIMVRYVNQPLIGSLIDKLAAGGFFICEQHLKTTEDVIGPRTGSFRLEPGDLLNASQRLRVHYYEEGIVADPDGRHAALAQVVASRGGADLLVG